MKLEGKKIGILMEGDFYEHEIWYYHYRFLEEGADLHFLTRLWGQSSLTFKGHEYHAPFEVRESFESIDDEDVGRLPPACEFIRRAFAKKNVLKGIICHGMWLLSPMPELVKGRRVTVHNNLVGDARNMGAVYVNEDVVVDNDLVTARTGGHCHLFARKIIDLLSE
jgi:protease I